MSCEHVKELLSAYLDNVLAFDEREAVTTHLQRCAECRAILEDYRRFDELLTQLPRISPGPVLRHKIFSSPEYLELTGTNSNYQPIDGPLNYRPQHDNSKPRLIALPGGRQSSQSPRESASDVPTARMPALSQQRSSHWRVMQALVAACILLTIMMGSFISWNIFKQQHPQASNVAGGITPPDAPQQGPISAGTRFIFLRDNALWSAPTDSSTHILRLSSPNAQVAANWVVRPARPGRMAGNMLAYIDLQHSNVHIVRSDGQNDTTLQPSLLKSGIQPAAVWDTPVGSAILNGLSWSSDGTMLTYVADVKGTGQTELFLYSTISGTTQEVPLPSTGRISHLSWSPDGVRLAFAIRQNGNTTIFDYNTENHSILTIASHVIMPDRSGDTLQFLGWSPAINTPILTWSLGNADHVHSIWTQQVGTAETTQPRGLIQGDYTQVSYTQSDAMGTGCWLLVSANGDLSSIDTAGTMNRLTSGKQAMAARWSPDGKYIDYLDGSTGATGTLHVINTSTGNDMPVASGITSSPAPTWSHDSQRLAYSNGTHTFVAEMQRPATLAQSLQLPGLVNMLSWSVTTPGQLVLVVSDGQRGIYLVDTQHNDMLRLDQKDMRGPIAWTQIP